MDRRQVDDPKYEGVDRRQENRRSKEINLMGNVNNRTPKTNFETPKIKEK